MNDSTAPSPGGPRWHRLLHSLAAAGLYLSATFLMILALAGFTPAASGALDEAFSGRESMPTALKITLSTGVILAILFPAIVMFVARRRKWIDWRFLAVGWLAVLPAFAWLAWDEPEIRHPLPIDQFSPAFPGADRSHAQLMQYSSQSLTDEAKAFERLTLRTPFTAAGTTRNPDQWIEFVKKERAALESDWAAIEPQRRWLAELAAFDRFGDLTPADTASSVLRFKVWRTLSQQVCARATLLALDGRGDEAVAELVPMLEAGRKLQPGARTLVRAMIGIVIERMCVETAGIILDLGPVSAASRARLAAAIEPENATAMARRLVLVEYSQFAPIYFKTKLGDQVASNWKVGALVRGPLNFLSGLIINPNASINLHGEHVFELAALAEARELGQFAVRRQGFDKSLLRRPAMKNLGGRLMLNLSIPAYDKVLESHWVTADARAALRRRLAAPS